MNVLVLNCGSSSIKYEVFEIENRSSRASGLLERIGEPESRLCHRGLNAPTMEDFHRTALPEVFQVKAFTRVKRSTDRFPVLIDEDSCAVKIINAWK